MSSNRQHTANNDENNILTSAVTYIKTHITLLYPVRKELDGPAVSPLRRAIAEVTLVGLCMGDQKFTISPMLRKAL
jgi:hypothetical protein